MLNNKFLLPKKKKCQIDAFIRFLNFVIVLIATSYIYNYISRNLRIYFFFFFHLKNSLIIRGELRGTGRDPPKFFDNF